MHTPSTVNLERFPKANQNPEQKARDRIDHHLGVLCDRIRATTQPKAAKKPRQRR